MWGLFRSTLTIRAQPTDQSKPSRTEKETMCWYMNTAKSVNMLMGIKTCTNISNKLFASFPVVLGILLALLLLPLDKWCLCEYVWVALNSFQDKCDRIFSKELLFCENKAEAFQSASKAPLVAPRYSAFFLCFIHIFLRRLGVPCKVLPVKGKEASVPWLRAASSSVVFHESTACLELKLGEVRQTHSSFLSE